MLGRPDVSGALKGLVESRLGSTHGIVSGCLGLVVVGRVLACVGSVCIGNIGSMGPTIIKVIVSLAIRWSLGPCWWIMSWTLVGIGRLVVASCWGRLIWIVGRETWWRQGRPIGWHWWRLWRRCRLVLCRGQGILGWRHGWIVWWLGIWWWSWSVGGWRPVVATLVVVVSAAATTTRLLLVLWRGRSGGQEHDMLLDVSHLLLQLLVLDRHVGQLRVEISVGGGQLCEC